MTVGLVKFVSKYRFVTTNDQLDELVKAATENIESIAGTIVIVDANLLYLNRSRKVITAFGYLLTVVRKIDKASVLIVANTDTLLDKRVSRLITHTTRLLSEEIPYEEEVK